MGRGVITPEIQAKSKELLGIEIDRDQLRLMPYLQYTMMNNQTLDRERIAGHEVAIIADWSQKGWITYAEDSKYIRCTLEFWLAMNEILWMSYVDLKEKS